MPNPPDTIALENELGLSFRNKELLEQALVHSSYLNENPKYLLASNERLEFLGDALVDLAVAHELFQRNATLSEGQLTQYRSVLVMGETLARVAKSLHIGRFLLMGLGEERSGGRQRDSNLAGAFEALVGALFLDQGYETASSFVHRALAKEIDLLHLNQIHKDAKSLLQELAQERGLSFPRYEIVEVVGPDHDRRFTVEAAVGDKVLGRGIGRRKADAEQEAAQQALDALT